MQACQTSFGTMLSEKLKRIDILLVKLNPHQFVPEKTFSYFPKIAGGVGPWDLPALWRRRHSD